MTIQEQKCWQKSLKFPPILDNLYTVFAQKNGICRDFSEKKYPVYEKIESRLCNNNFFYPSTHTFFKEKKNKLDFKQSKRWNVSR